MLSILNIIKIAHLLAIFRVPKNSAFRYMESIQKHFGHGWFIKQSRRMRKWIVDPFVLRDGGIFLIADRMKRRFLFETQSSYHFINLEVSPLRKLTMSEYSVVVSSKIANKLGDDFSILSGKCFDISFGRSGHEKSMIVFSPYD